MFMDYSPFNISVASYKQVYEALDASVDPLRTLAPNAAVYFVRTFHFPLLRGILTLLERGIRSRARLLT